MPLDVVQLTPIVALILALSVATERLVEIIKGLFRFLNQEHSNPTQEGRRKAALQALAVGGGIFTAFLAHPALPLNLQPSAPTYVALGLLASGGSGLWNAILTWMLQLKNIKEQVAKDAATTAALREIDLQLKSLERSDLADHPSELAHHHR